MKINDDQLSTWTKHWFDNQKERAEETKETVKAAVDNHLSDLGIRVFAKRFGHLQQSLGVLVLVHPPYAFMNWKIKASSNERFLKRFHFMLNTH